MSELTSRLQKSVQTISDAHKTIENLRSGGDGEGDAAVAFREQLDGALPTNLKNAAGWLPGAAGRGPGPDLGDAAGRRGELRHRRSRGGQRHHAGVGRREIPWTPPKPAAAQAATARRNALPVSVADLPCGPGACTESLVELPAQADARQRSLYEATAYLPFPDGRDLAVTAVDAHEHHRDVHRAMAERVSFDNPLPEEFKAQIPESEVEASVHAVFG